MANMTALDFSAMIEDTTVNTAMIEYREPATGENSASSLSVSLRRARSAAARSSSCSTSGSALSDNVSPVSAFDSLPIAQMSPATTVPAGRCCFPKGNDSVPIRSSSSWSWWPPELPLVAEEPKKD